MDPADERRGGEFCRCLRARGLVRGALGHRRAAQGAEDGLRGGGLGVSPRGAVAAGDRLAVGGGGVSAAVAGSEPPRGSQGAARAGSAAEDLGGGAESLALEGNAAGLDGVRFLL